MRTIVTNKDVRDFLIKNSSLYDENSKFNASMYMSSVSTNPKISLVLQEAVTDAMSQKLKKDDIKDRIIKYIPGEVVAMYIFLTGIANQLPSETKPLILWIILIVLTLGTWLYLERIEKVKKTDQLIITTISFVVWVFALGGPFVYLDWYFPAYGQLLLGLYTFFVGIIEPR